MLKKIKLSVLLIFIAGSYACQSTETQIHTAHTNTMSANITHCSNPRPEVCTREYRPVCATRETGKSCITTPCSSSEEKTYPTGCTACSDEKVSHYRKGAC